VHGVTDHQGARADPDRPDGRVGSAQEQAGIAEGVGTGEGHAADEEAFAGGCRAGLGHGDARVSDADHDRGRVVPGKGPGERRRQLRPETVGHRLPGRIAVHHPERIGQDRQRQRQRVAAHRDLREHEPPIGVGGRGGDRVGRSGQHQRDVEGSSAGVPGVHGPRGVGIDKDRSRHRAGGIQRRDPVDPGVLARDAMEGERQQPEQHSSLSHQKFSSIPILNTRAVGIDRIGSPNPGFTM
jgi:hypothetical protein